MQAYNTNTLHNFFAWLSRKDARVWLFMYYLILDHLLDSQINQKALIILLDEENALSGLNWVFA